MTSPPVNERLLLIVIGMHRSGTSALAASLHACGASVGEHLLPAQADINEEGFWEDEAVVSLNERLLDLLGWRWYAIGAPGEADWHSARFSELAHEADSLLQAGFGEGSVQLIKDPRLCVTLPFWAAACERTGLAFRPCLIDRPTGDVARSLAKRDGFPESYGRWLSAMYLQHRDAALGPAPAISYADLLADPATVIEKYLAVESIPLHVDREKLASTVRADLNHSIDHGESEPVTTVVTPDMLGDLARSFVERGHELTRIADEHTYAMSVIGERDQQIAGQAESLEKLGSEHSEALATIEERDEQLRSVNSQLAGLGSEHREALDTIAERDEQLAHANEKIAELGDAHGYAISVVEERDAQLAERNGEIAGLQQELEQREALLAFYRTRIDRLVAIPLFGLLARRFFRRPDE